MRKANKVVDETTPMQVRIASNSDKWDAGEHVFGMVEERLMNTKEGDMIGSTLSFCTICPVHNGSCVDMIRVSICGFHPEKADDIRQVDLCPLSISGDGERCPLNK